MRYWDTQILAFNFADRGELRACQNMWPQENALVLTRGTTGIAGLTPMVSCPLDKLPFSLETGQCLLPPPPPERQLDTLLSNTMHLVRSGDAAGQACAACA